VIDYGMGNLRSVLKAWETVGAAPRLIQHPREAASAEALVFPGQGAIVDTMKLLKQKGFDLLLRDWIDEDRPFFGICLGLQALFEHSDEGDTPGLCIFPGKVQRFAPPPGCKVPHMGWNQVTFKTETRPDPLLDGIDPTATSFYFVHSYFAVPENEHLIFGETRYADRAFCCAIRRGNLVATQFHPEKSQRGGLQLYANFLSRLAKSKD
jgi:imidazole glycerol-phosphate synthase subunit HisH